jgi:gentisate 1,2-dioxygenase
MSRFVDITGQPRHHDLDWWEPVVIRRAEIEAEAARLAALPAPADGRRESLIVHPRAEAPGLGLAPGIRVTLSVLMPGERTRPIRHNSTQLSFCIEGGGHSVVAGRRIGFERYDVWNQPSYSTYWHVNDTDEAQVRLTYSNAALLEALGVHLVDEEPDAGSSVDGQAAEREAVVGEAVEAAAASGAGETADDDPSRTSPFGTFELGEGAWLMPYERLINPPAVVSAPLHWPWHEVRAHLDKLVALGESYRGRRLYLLYNPVTGRTNGTTPNFFATMTIRPPGIIDRPHRHVSAAINYYFHGSGRSIVAGKRYEWEAGDLMLSAPGWAIHHHASGPDDHVYELTVQDQPFHLALESLLWQEDLRRPARVLGTEAGFDTNRPLVER